MILGPNPLPYLELLAKIVNSFFAVIFGKKLQRKVETEHFLSIFAAELFIKKGKY